MMASSHKAAGVASLHVASTLQTVAQGQLREAADVAQVYTRAVCPNIHARMTSGPALQDTHDPAARRVESSMSSCVYLLSLHALAPAQGVKARQYATHDHLSKSHSCRASFEMRSAVLTSSAL
jgi:hypothetical protein